MAERPLRVLLIEDDPSHAALLQVWTELEANMRFQFTHTSTLREALERLHKESFEAILLDLCLPDSDGLSTFQTLHQEFSEIPIVVLTATNDENLAIAAVKAGAQDYLVKGEVTPSLLSRSVRYAVERQWIRGVMQGLLFVDELTGLYNRRGFSTLAEQQLKLAKRTHRGLSLIFVDLDGLKQINDKFGHTAGDQALQQTARVLRDTFRETDIIARAGGDEFTVLAIDTAENNSEKLTARLQKNLDLANATPNQPYRLSLSFGLSQFDPSQTEDVQELLRKADAAMYQQKQEKKARIK